MNVVYSRPHVTLECIHEGNNPESCIFNIHWEKAGVWHKFRHPFGNSPELMIGIDVLSDILSLPPTKFSGRRLRYDPDDRCFYWKNQKLASSRMSPELAFKIREFILNSILQRV